MSLPDTGARSSLLAAVLRRPVLSRYLAVSLLALVIDYACLVSLVRWTGLGGVAAGALAYCAGAVAHYAASRRYVFAPGWMHARRLAEFAGFFASGLVGLALTVITLDVGLRLLGLPILACKSSAVAISFCITYLLRDRWVFRT